VLEVDAEAGKKIHEIWPKTNFIYFNVKEFEELRERMKKRFFFCVFSENLLKIVKGN